MQHKPRLFCFLAAFLLGYSAGAQNIEVGVVGGGSGYIGDLNQNNPVKISGVSLGGYVKANLDAYWSVGLNYRYGKIKGNDLKSDNQQFRDRGLNFSTSLNEISSQVEFNFLDYYVGGGTKRFTPYIFAGVGLVFFNPTAYYPNVPELGDKTYKLRFYKTENQYTTYRNYAISIPYGAGAKFGLNDNWGLFTQIGYRTAYTDYLDDVSGRYADGSNWPNDGNLIIRQKLANPTDYPYAAPLVQRGDFRKRDTYMFVGIGISYTFVSQKCYTF